MPYIYAIEHRSAERYDRSLDKHTVVDEETARADPDGCWMIAANTGIELTEWNRFEKDREAALVYADESEYKHDALGQDLRAHDFVMTTTKGYSTQYLAEVVGFTEVKVRIRMLNQTYTYGVSTYKTILKDCNDLVRVDPNLIL